MDVIRVKLERWSDEVSQRVRVLQRHLTDFSEGVKMTLMGMYIV